MDGPLPTNMVPAWRRFFEAHPRPALDGSGVCEAVFADGLLFPLQRRQELARMLQIAAGVRPKVVAEIGCDKCGSLAHWCMLPTVEAAVACEVRGVDAWREFNHAFPGIDFLWLDSSSHAPGTVERVGRWLARQTIDVLFIDGDKARFDDDWSAYLPLMSPRGVVFFHDINDEGRAEKDRPSPMRAAFERARVGRRWEEIIDVSEVPAAMTRLAGGLPPATAYEGWLRHWAGTSCGVGVVYLGGEA